MFFNITEIQIDMQSQVMDVDQKESRKVYIYYGASR